MNAMIPSTRSVTYADICAASLVLKSVAHQTPVVQSAAFNQLTQAQVYFKCEHLQKMGAFKFRGAYYAISLLSDAQRQKGIVAFSSGNHAQAVALAAKMFGISATVFMPEDAPQAKIAAVREYGAHIILYNRYTDDRIALTHAFMQQTGAHLVSPYDDADVVAGQGTAAKELFEEVGTLDYLLVSVGGGGLLAGSAIAAHTLSPDCRVMGIEPELGNDGQQSLAAGHIIRITPPPTIADGAGTAFLGELNFRLLQQYACTIETVTEAEIAEQVRFFIQRMKMVVEPTGALPAAAVRKYADQLQGKKIGVILSGGNIDLPVLEQICRNT